MCVPRLNANESELEAVRLRLADAETWNGWTKSKVDGGTGRYITHPDCRLL